jgi:hypothetical protein
MKIRFSFFQTTQEQDMLPTHLQAHCQSPTSQRYNQSFVKEFAKPMHREKLFKNFADTFLIKADTQVDRKNESKRR